MGKIKKEKIKYIFISFFVMDDNILIDFLEFNFALMKM